MSSWYVDSLLSQDGWPLMSLMAFDMVILIFCQKVGVLSCFRFRILSLLQQS